MKKILFAVLSLTAGMHCGIAQNNDFRNFAWGSTPFYCGSTISDLGIKVVAAANQNGIGATTPFCYLVASGGSPLNGSTLLTNGTTYYLSQNLDGLCESIRVPLTVSVITTPYPTGNILQNFTQGQTLSNLQVTGTNLIWYANQSDATNHVNPIINTTLLVNGSTYYVTQTNNGCESSPLAITVNVALGINDFQKDKFIYYPNPLSSVVNFENNNTIIKIALFNFLGQRLEEKEINSLSGQLDMSKLPNGNYLLRFKTENGESTIKLVKN